MNYIKILLIILTLFFLLYLISKPKLRYSGQFRGQDEYLNTNTYKHSNILFCTLDYNSKNGIEIMEKRLIDYLNKSFCILRYKISDDANSFYYVNQKSKKLVKKILYKVDKLPPEKYCTDLILKLKLGMIFFITKKQIILIANHQLVDGIRIFSILSELFDNPIMDKKFIPQFNYLPIITELYTLPKLPWILSKLPKRHLSYDLPWEKIPQCYQGEHNGKLEEIKNIKSYIEEKVLKKKLPFSCVLSGLIVCKLFDNLNNKKNKLTIGIIAAFKNKSFFNNFSVIPVEVKKNKNWNKMSFKKKFTEIILYINNYVYKWGESYLATNYVATNIYNFKFYINNFIDILIANLPTTQPFRFGGNDLELTSLNMKYISFPMYVNMLSWNGKYKITYTSRTYDIDNDKFIKNGLI